MQNSVHLTGICVETPELKITKATGVFVICFQLAVVRKETQGNETPETDYFDIVAFNGIAEVASRYLIAGSMVVVDGRLRTRACADSGGKQMKVVEVIAEDIYTDTKAKPNQSIEIRSMSRKDSL